MTLKVKKKSLFDLHVTINFEVLYLLQNINYCISCVWSTVQNISHL